MGIRAAKETRDLFTTSEIGRIVGVTPRTVAKWIDGDMLAGYRVPGSGGYRRVRRADLLAFLVRHEMPVPEFLKKQLEPENVRPDV